jgi:hypothetical protein
LPHTFIYASASGYHAPCSFHFGAPMRTVGLYDLQGKKEMLQEIQKGKAL